MSIIFGVRKSERDLVIEPQLLDLARATDQWAPDGTFVNMQGHVGMGFQPYHTHQRSNLESQPPVDQFGNMATLDGRLDNHKELREQLDVLESDTPDSLIALAAFRRWGEECFAKLIGDWALVIWSQMDRSLYLARDHAGTRTLYFENTEKEVLWSTHLETFSLDDATRALDRHYAACYLSGRPTGDLTPYRGIVAVTPAHYITIRKDRVSRKPHWQAPHRDQIRYKSDTEYEQHFLSLFKQSVNRRADSGTPILAQLSGGMDSTSIVCISDRICREAGGTSEDLVDTISFYDNSEPNWNEVPYFTAVENARGKSGIHVDTSQSRDFFQSAVGATGLYPLPGADNSTRQNERRLANLLADGGYRVILSGVGGDEVLGGVSTPLPELADQLMAGHFCVFMRRAIQWCVYARRPIAEMILDTVRFLTGTYLGKTRGLSGFPPWVNQVASHSEDGRRGRSGLSLFLTGVAPSSINNGKKWIGLLETMPHSYPSAIARPEYRYPFLDRDLVEFLFRIPQQQLVRPGRRRYLMRRALVGIVPNLVLERKRKGYLVNGAIRAAQALNARFDVWLSDALIAQHGLVEPNQLRSAVHASCTSHHTEWLRAISRAMAFEFWLKTNGLLKAATESPGLPHRGSHPTSV
jgi:asparagine synthase (glutamine-hydrolysing)